MKGSLFLRGTIEKAGKGEDISHEFTVGFFSER